MRIHCFAVGGCCAHAGVRGGLRTGLAELHRFSNVQLERALVMFRCSQVSQLTFTVDEPHGTCDDADAHCWVTRTDVVVQKTIYCLYLSVHAECPTNAGEGGFLAAAEPTVNKARKKLALYGVMTRRINTKRNKFIDTASFVHLNSRQSCLVHDLAPGFSNEF